MTLTHQDQDNERQAAKNSPPAAAPRSDHLPIRRSAETMLNELNSRLLEISVLVAVGSLLSWDQATYIPRGGAAARGRHSAMLRRLAHEQLVDAGDGRSSMMSTDDC